MLVISVVSNGFLFQLKPNFYIQLLEDNDSIINLKVLLV